MADEFGKTTDQGSQDGTGFDQSNQPDNGGKTDGPSMTTEELAALQKRDGAAQAHIQQLESEMKTLRESKEELANSLASATTLDDVMARMNNPDQGDSGASASESVDPNKVADLAVQRLEAKAAQDVAQRNWDSVVGKLTETYGDWEKADLEISSRAAALDMDPQEATVLARKSPEAFYQLFLPKQASVSQSSAASATSKQTSVADPVGTGRDKEYYAKMRREQPRKYWGVDVQEQMRRDLYSD